MKNNVDNFIEKSFASLNEISNPTQEQKQGMLSKVLFEANIKTNIQANIDSNIHSNNQIIDKRYTFKNMVFVYPWRFALGASTIQAIVLTSIFGTKYTNLVFQFLGR